MRRDLWLLMMVMCVLFFGCGQKFFNQSYIIINDHLIVVEIADSIEERVRGLSYKENLAEENGMWFILDEEEIGSYWMKGMLFPIDLLYIDKNYRITDIYENLQPCLKEPCESYYSSREIKYVLEVNAAFSRNNGIQRGDMVKFFAGSAF